MDEQKHYTIPQHCGACGTRPVTVCLVGERDQNGDLRRPEFLCDRCENLHYGPISKTPQPTEEEILEYLKKD